VATWRGILTRVEPITGRRHILGFRLFVTFEILDPGVVHRTDEAWDYNLAWIEGMTPLEIRNLVLDQGGPVIEVGPPAPPGTFTAPDPPPLRDRGAAILAEWQAANGPSGITLPVSFTVP
jgi:hypothetical protein